jgi:hypothetical protein
MYYSVTKVGIKYLIAIRSVLPETITVTATSTSYSSSVMEPLYVP